MRLLFKYDKEWTLYPWRCSLTTKGEHSTRNKQTLSLLTCIFVHERDYYHILPQNIILSEHRVLERDVKDFIQISDVVHVILVVGLCSWAQLPAAVREISPRSTETARVSSSQRLPWVPEVVFPRAWQDASVWGRERQSFSRGSLQRLKRNWKPCIKSLWHLGYEKAFLGHKNSSYPISYSSTF